MMTTKSNIELSTKFISLVLGVIALCSTLIGVGTSAAMIRYNINQKVDDTTFRNHVIVVKELQTDFSSLLVRIDTIQVRQMRILCLLSEVKHPELLACDHTFSR